MNPVAIENLCRITRRHFLGQAACGLGSAALFSMLRQSFAGSFSPLPEVFIFGHPLQAQMIQEDGPPGAAGNLTAYCSLPTAYSILP